jgi:O-antigen ligase
MPEHLRALVFVLACAIPAFFLAKKIAVPFVDEDEFIRWRNCWLATTCAVFLSSSFVIFSAFMVLLAVYIHRKAKQPLYFYIILISAAPCLPVDVGIPGLFNKIMELNSARLVSLLILLPIAIGLMTRKSSKPPRQNLAYFDICAGLLFFIVTILSARHGEFNAVLRVVLQNFMDLVLPYFVISRAIASVKDFNLALIAYAVAAMPLSAIGFLEMWKQWRFYYIVVQRWEIQVLTPYLMRDDMLRAANTSIEPIAFGFLCMVAAGYLIIARTGRKWTIWHYAGLGLIFVGLYSSLSRGPWLGFAIFIGIISLAYLRKATTSILAAIPVLLAGLYFTPPAMIERFLGLLPFMGTVDKGNEQYRTDLLTNSLVVIQRYPIFGSEKFSQEPEMQAMIQGQGIIDIVNSYLQFALEFGLVTLGLFLAVFLGLAATLLVKALRPTLGPDKVDYAGLFAILISMLVVIATVSSISTIPYTYWTFAGLVVGLLRLGREAGREETQTSLQTPARMRVLRPF